MSKTTKTRTQTSVENGVKVLKTAIKKGISLSEASRQSKFGRNYVSDIKSRLTDNFKNKNVTKDSYTEFKTLVKEYNKK